MGTFLFLWAISAWAANDSRDLAEARLKERDKVSFYCVVGRQPIPFSSQALSVAPDAQCKFKGPLDTVRDKLSLQPPFLNPYLRIEDAQAFVREANIAGMSARRVPFSGLKDPLMRFGSYPVEWGLEFTVIQASSQSALAAFIQMSAENKELYWANPHFEIETRVVSRLTAKNSHRPLPLTPRCTTPNLNSTRGILFVAEMHRPEDANYLLNLVSQLQFAWLGLEISRDFNPPLQTFLGTSDWIVEERALDKILSRIQTNRLATMKSILRSAKAQRMPVVLMDYAQSYFNFPYTNTQFHGLAMATRNKMWVDSFPANWSGTGVVFAGLAHFTETPGSDVQDFLSEKYGAVDSTLINPLEICSPNSSHQRN